MTAKKKATKKVNPNKQLELQEEIRDLILRTGEELDEVLEKWDRFQEKGIKRSFKEARKLILKTKKSCAEIRKTMSSVEL